MTAFGSIGYPGGYFAQFHFSNLHKIVNKDVTYVPSSTGILGGIQAGAAPCCLQTLPGNFSVKHPIRGKLEAQPFYALGLKVAQCDG